MSYESRAFDEPTDGFGPEPVVVLVVRGTDDVSRLINLFAGSQPVIEQLQVGEQIRSQVRRHNGGRAALELLRRRGGPDFTTDPVTLEPASVDGDAAVVSEFCDERAQYVTAISNCHPGNSSDYYRWQGHIEARRQLVQRLERARVVAAVEAEGGA